MRENQTLEVLRQLADFYQQMQKVRIQQQLRFGAIQRGADDQLSVHQRELLGLYQELAEVEQNAERLMAKMGSTVPLVQDLCQVRGVGLTLACKLAALIDVEKADTVSALWRFCGLGVGEDGLAEKPKKGERLHYSKRAKTVCYQIGTSFIKQRARYCHIYYKARQEYEQKHPEWNNLRRHYAAWRKMMKVFLAHLWERERRRRGLPVRSLYVHEKLGHTWQYDPEWYWSNEKLEEVPAEPASQ